MLVFTRIVDKDDEIVMSFNGNKALIKILSTKGNRVKVGIDAPKDIIVDRKEVSDRKGE